MTDKEYLFYVVSTSEVILETYSKHRYFDMNVVQVEPSFKKFCKEPSSLKKIVYLEEQRISNNLIFNHVNFKNLDALFLVDFCDGTNVYTIEKLKNWIEINQIPDEKILIISHSEHERELIKRIMDKNLNINFVIVQGPLYTAFREFLGKRYKKRFLFLSRNWNCSRLISFIDLKRRGILENCYYSFFNVKNIYSNPNSDPFMHYSMTEIENYFNRGIQSITAENPQWAKELHEYWNDEKIKIVEGMPYLLENETKEVSGRPGQQFISNTLQDAFTNSAISLLVETNALDSADHFQCTEKTYKSMIYRHPFFVYATQHQLHRTRQYGFKTFSNAFDETYDTLDSVWSRIYHIHNQVEILNNMPIGEFKKTIYKTISETTHNYNIIMNKLVDIKSNINYQTFDKRFDNLLLDKIPSPWFDNQY